MAANYPILHVYVEIHPKILETRVSDLALSFIQKGTFNFAVKQVPDLAYLTERYEWEQSGEFEHGIFGTINDPAKYLAGYNQSHRPLTISDPNEPIGAVQIIGNQMIFLRKGVSLNHDRDGYNFGTANDQFYTAIGFSDVIKEFLGKGYVLVVNDNLALIESTDSIPRKLEPPTLEDMAKIGLS